VEDVAAGGEVKTRGIIVQKKTGRPVQFEITEQTRNAVLNLIRRHYLRSDDYLFPSRLANSPHLSTRQYARIVQGWVGSIGLNPATYGTHSLRRTKAALIYRKTGNLRAVQLLLGHSKLESTVRYLGVEVDDAIAISEGVDL
jgi:integrase